MRDEAHHKAIEVAASQAKSDRDAEHTRGFIIVKWMDRYSYFLTPVPHADLEQIVNTRTLAEIVARYARVDGMWVRLPLHMNGKSSEDGSGK